LVEASIRYLPLYPDDSDVVFNEGFLTSQPNILAEILPECASFTDVIRVIDIPASTDGQFLQVLMNADQEQAVALLSGSGGGIEPESKRIVAQPATANDAHWHWRLKAAEDIAAQLNPQRFGVKGFYIFGSVKNASAGPESDIDILIHFAGTDMQRKELLAWLEGWNLSLSQIRHPRTWFKTSGLLDIHLVTDEDVKKGTGYAAKIGAVTDPAKPLPMGTRQNG
jgi:predicted nucleotidyltransferase